MVKKGEEKKYSAESIEVLEGLEPVRKRPGMYIGGTDSVGLHHLVKEILDNSIDEAMNGHASKIIVQLHADSQSVTISDNGRGIPVDKHPKLKKPALEVIMTTLHSGGKFSDRNYISAGGLHGVGASVVNALSAQMIVRVCRDGYEWEQEFSRGKAKGKLVQGSKTEATGTEVYFQPDEQIFKNIKFDPKKIAQLVEVKAFLNHGLRIIFKDDVNKTEQEYKFDHGLKAYLLKLCKEDEVEPIGGEVIHLEKDDGVKAEIAFAWTESPACKILSYVNGIPTANGGTHEDGFKNGLSRALRNYINVHEVNIKGIKLTGDDMREGLVAIVSAIVPGSVAQLQFQGQTKDRLNNPEVQPPIEKLTAGFENILNAKATLANQIIERIVLAARARTAARQASSAVSRKVGIGRRLNLPGKLADCSTSSSDKAELFIVEGDSAGGSAKQGRDRNTQAIFPLRGKVLNSIAAGGEKVSANQELMDLVSAIGCGMGAELNPAKVRYSKVVILTDADSDGMHIATLLMAFFYKHMRKLINAGNIYLGQPPLYRIRIGSGEKEETHWVYSDEEKEKLVKKYSNRKYSVTRFKGLGEMNPETLWDTTLNPKTRSLLQVKIEDESKAAKTLEDLFGKDAQQRFRLIQDNAHRIELDV